ncbi:MAG TPA: methyltransferase domain-containing protein [Gammaproteobacteria bacterium]
MAAIYGEDLAHIQIAGFGAMAQAVGPQVVALLGEHGIHGGTIGDVGCGAGVTTRCFLDAGFDVWALEPSAALLAAARAHAPEATFLPRGSAYETALPPADAIVAIGEPLNYHSPQSDADERVRGFFARAAAALRPGGMLAFDVIVRGDVSLDGRSWSAGEDWAVLVETSERADGWLRREIETFVRRGCAYRRGHETHHVRVFDREELAAALRATGFDVQTSGSWGAYRLAPRRCAFVCRRVGGRERPGAGASTPGKA